MTPSRRDRGQVDRTPVWAELIRGLATIVAALIISRAIFPLIGLPIVKSEVKTAVGASLRTGNWSGSSADPDWVLMGGSGGRRDTVWVDFDPPFSGTPSVFLSVTEQEWLPLFDGMANTIEKRFSLRVLDNIRKDGFGMEIRVWGRSSLKRLGINWLTYCRPNSE